MKSRTGWWSSRPRSKPVGPSALVVGPEEWGWSGYFFSGYDQQWGSTHGWSSLPDRDNHGGADYLTWLLGQIRQSSITLFVVAKNVTAPTPPSNVRIIK